MKRSTLYLGFLSILTFLLTACGGGNDGALQLGGISSYSLTLTAAPSTSVSAATPVTLTANVLQPDGVTPVAGATVTFHTTAGRLPVTTNTTTAAGNASVLLYAGSNGPASGTVTAIYVDPQGNTARRDLAVTTAGDEATTTPGTAQPTITLSALNSSGVASDSANPITSTAPGTLRAQVLNSTGTPVSNAIVTFNAGALASLSQTTALTDATGVAQVTITATSAGAGTATASTLVGGASLTASAVYAATIGGTTGGTTTGASMALEVRTSSGVLVDSSNPLTNLAPGTLTAILTQNGTPISNALVTFTATSSVSSLTQTSALTNSAGRAVVPITATATGAGSATATATVNGVVVTQSAVYATSAGGGVSDVPVITLAVLDAANNPVSASNPITDAANGKLRATITIATVPQSNQVVTFALSSGSGAALTQTVALTNASGVAEVPISASATGAGTVTASATVNSVNVSSVQTYATTVSAPQPLTLDLGNLSGAVFTPDVLGSNAPAQIAPGTSVIITADVINTATNLAHPDSVNIVFSSNCSVQGRATIDSTVATASGRAVAIYVPGSCTGSDTITAVLQTPTQTLTATTNVSIIEEEIGRIEFDSVSINPPVLALKGTGGLGRPESADVFFKVVGTQGSPLVSKTVCFGLSTTVGGITIEPAKATSDGAGKVKVTVGAGSIPTPVRVNAFVDDNDNCSDKPNNLIQTVSSQLTVSTGLPDQKSFSLAVSNFNPLAYNYNGVEVTATLFAADHFNNPVPDGTAITFWTESGAITPSCVTSNGVCTATWRSQDPRSSVDPRARSVTGQPYRDRKGRSSILAYAVGEESFVDLNGNGVWEDTEPFDDLAEVVKDTNLNDARENLSGVLEEEFVDFNVNQNFDAANGRYDGVLCSLASRNSGTCSGNATVHVRDFSEIVLSTNSAKVYFVNPNVDISNIDFDANGNFIGIVNPADTAYVNSADGQTITQVLARRNRTFSLLATDSNGNTLASGTTITVRVVDAETTGSIVGTSSYTIPQVSGLADWFAATFTLKAPTDLTKAGVGPVEVEISHTDGIKEYRYLSIDWVTP